MIINCYHCKNPILLPDADKDTLIEGVKALSKECSDEFEAAKKRRDMAETEQEREGHKLAMLIYFQINVKLDRLMAEAGVPYEVV